MAAPADHTLQLQSSESQRGLAAEIRERAKNSDRTLLKNERQFLNRVVHDSSMTHDPEIDRRLNHLAERTGSRAPGFYEDATKETRGNDGLSSALMVFGAIASLGAASYSAYQERQRIAAEKQKAEAEKKRIEAEKKRIEALIQQKKDAVKRFISKTVVRGGLLAWLWYAGWLGDVPVVILLAMSCCFN